MRKLSTFLFVLSIHAVALAQSGALDPTFGTNGRFNFNPDIINEQVQGIAITQDNKTLVLINNNVLDWIGHQTYLVRFNSNGTLDSTFGDNGVLQILEDLFFDLGYSIAVDDSNRIIVLDFDQEYGGSIRIFRLNENGTPDSTFGGVHLSMDKADNGLLVQHDGKILVGGYDYSVRRINSDGSLDASFNSLSTAALGFSLYEFVLGIAQQADDKLLFTGNNDSTLFVARLINDGTADNSFGVNGIVIIDSSGDDAGQHVTEMPDGKIIVTGYTQTDSSSNFYCWRFNADGSADNSFGNNGSSLLFSGHGDNLGFFVFPSADSAAIVVGSVFNGACNDPVILRLTNDGTIDSTFGVSGLSGKTFTNCKSIELGACLDNNGKIVIGGTGTFNGNNELALSRFTAGGNVDSTFGINGTVSKNILDSEYIDKSVSDFAILPDGKFLGAGSAFDLAMFRLDSSAIIDSSYGVQGIIVPASQRLIEHGSLVRSNSSNVYVVENFVEPVFGYSSFDYDFDSYGFAVHKFKPNGTIDSSYGTNGIIEPFMIGYSLSSVRDIGLQPDGKLLLCGFTPYNFFNTDMYVIRLNGDGSFDETFGNQGIVTFNWTQADLYLSMDLSVDGKIVLQESSFPGNQTLLRTERLLSDGTPDVTFGNNGQKDDSIGFNHASHETKVQPDKKILTMIAYSSNGSHYEILRLNENGEVDSTFGANGYASLEDAGFLSTPVMLVQPDGKILCFATSHEAGYTLTIARVTNSGTFDGTFGTGGITVFDTSFVFEALAMHLQEDDKIVVAGSSDYTNFYMARFLNDVGIPLQADYTKSSQVRVYPNPTAGVLIINSPSLSKQAKITLRDIAGKTLGVLKVNSIDNQYQIKVDDLPAGIYFLTIQTEDNSASIKFVKQ